MKIKRYALVVLSLTLLICLSISAPDFALAAHETNNVPGISYDVPATSSDLVPFGWYDARYTDGASIRHANGEVEELLSYQELYGKDPAEPVYPPILLEFYSKAFCLGATLVDTDSWPGIISTAGQTFVCYSYSAFESALEMPYPDIEKNTVVIDSGVTKEIVPVPGTIYICM